MLTSCHWIACVLPLQAPSGFCSHLSESCSVLAPVSSFLLHFHLLDCSLHHLLHLCCHLHPHCYQLGHVEHAHGDMLRPAQLVQQLAGARRLEQLDPMVFVVAIGQPFPLAAVVLLAVQVRVCSLVARPSLEQYHSSTPTLSAVVLWQDLVSSNTSQQLSGAVMRPSLRQYYSVSSSAQQWCCGET